MSQAKGRGRVLRILQTGTTAPRNKFIESKRPYTRVQVQNKTDWWWSTFFHLEFFHPFRLGLQSRSIWKLEVIHQYKKYFDEHNVECLSILKSEPRYETQARLVTNLLILRCLG